MTTTQTTSAAPLTDVVIYAVARLIDDGQLKDKREPSHPDLQSLMDRSGVPAEADPNRNLDLMGRQVGKEKRVHYVLNWALKNDLAAGERFVGGLIRMVRGLGGFRPGSPNYAGQDAVAGAIDAFRAAGFVLTSEGDLHPTLLDNLAGRDLTGALRLYVRRAQAGVTDAVLVTDTAKDLVEATAAHVLTEVFGGFAEVPFPTLLGQAFAAVQLSASMKPVESAREQLDRRLYEAACSVNRLRNREAGHGKPFLSSVTDSEARAAATIMGAVSARLLDCLPTLS
jgi:hypothetical protein